MDSDVQRGIFFSPGKKKSQFFVIGIMILSNFAKIPGTSCSGSPCFFSTLDSVQVYMSVAKALRAQVSDTFILYTLLVRSRLTEEGMDHSTRA